MARLHSTCHKGHYCKWLSAQNWRVCGYTSVWNYACCSICQCLNHRKIIIIWSFNCLIAVEAKCHLCKGSDFIVRLMTCMFKHINITMQAFTRITGSICSCLVIGVCWLDLSINCKYHERKRQRWVKIWLVCRYMSMPRICVAMHVVVNSFSVNWCFKYTYKRLRILY